MATYTEHYNLKKPDLSDIANIGDINDNMDIIDEEMSKLIDSVPTMSGASASTDGESGVVPQPVAGDNAKYLRGDATYSVPGVMTINGRTPDPVTGDITVIEGGGSGSYGSYRLDATIPVSAWSGSGPYTTTITNEYIKSTMDGSETWLDNEAAMLGETTFTTRDGSLLVSTTVKPTAQWVLHVALALNGADVLADMSASIANVADGLAILATGDTHAQIAKGQFVYVRNHGTANGFSGTAVLADGLYVATAAINANGSLTTSNLAADGAGGLNALKADYDALNSKTIKKMDFTATTSANGNASLMEVIDTTKYTVISVSAHKTATPNDIVICIPYQYTSGRPGRINAVHCIGETNTYEVIANTSITGVLFYAEI